MNNVVLIGRLTRDPELSIIEAYGKTVARFTLAVDRRHKSSQGERETDFIPVTMWGKRAETAGQYLTKGRMVCVTGSLKVSSFQDKDGNFRYFTEVIADGFQFLDSQKAI